MAGAARGENPGDWERLTPQARAHYAREANRQGREASLADILADYGYELENRGMPQVDGQGRRIGGRHGVRGVGRFGAHWNRERDGGHTGGQGGGGYTAGGDPDPGAQGW